MNTGVCDKMSQWYAEMMASTLNSVVGVPAKDLTEQQRFAVAVYAGVPTEPSMGEGCKFTLRTVPCKIEDNGDGGFVVAWQDDYKRTVMAQVVFR